MTADLFVPLPSVLQRQRVFVDWWRSFVTIASGFYHWCNRVFESMTRRMLQDAAVVMKIGASWLRVLLDRASRRGVGRLGSGWDCVVDDEVDGIHRNTPRAKS